MPKLSTGKLPSYRRHKASGQAVVTLRGRDIYLGPYGTKASKAEYDRLVGEYLASGGTSPRVRRMQEITLVELLAGFVKHATSHYGPKSAETRNFRTLIRRLRKAYGSVLVSEFGPLKLKSFREILVAEGLARGNINHTVNRVRRIFKWGVENEVVHPDVLAALQAVAGLRYGKCLVNESEPVTPVPDIYVDATITCCCPQIATMIELQRLTGMRSGDVVRMRTCDISMQERVWTYTPAHHKTKFRGHTRIIYIGPKGQAFLRPWLRPDLEAHLFQPREAKEWHELQRHAKRKTTLRYGNRPGTNRVRKPKRKPGVRYDTGSYYRAIAYAIKRCNKQRADRGEPGIPNWHPHQLRHNFGTLARKQHGLEVARLLLGLKHIAITEIYAEADHQRAAEVAAKIG